MSKAKTRATEASVDAYLASRATEAQRADAAVLMAILGRVTGAAPRMWGPSIVGYGSYRYRYDSGRTGESCLAGFAIRGRQLVVYLSAEGPDQATLLQVLGAHTMGKACLYLRRLADVDVAILEQLVAASVAELRRRYPTDPEPPRPQAAAGVERRPRDR